MLILSTPLVFDRLTLELLEPSVSEDNFGADKMISCAFPVQQHLANKPEHHIEVRAAALYCFKDDSPASLPLWRAVTDRETTDDLPVLEEHDIVASDLQLAALNACAEASSVQDLQSFIQGESRACTWLVQGQSRACSGLTHGQSIGMLQTP